MAEGDAAASARLMIARCEIKDVDKTREQLLHKVEYLRRQIAGSESARRVAENEKLLFRKPTAHQREMLHWMAQGYSTKETAFGLGISVKTVETHRALMMARLKIFDIASLVRFAVRVGLVSLV